MEVDADGELAAIEVIFLLLEHQEATPRSPDGVGVAWFDIPSDLVDLV
jgi:hypothetical protein